MIAAGIGCRRLISAAQVEAALAAALQRVARGGHELRVIALPAAKGAPAVAHAAVAGAAAARGLAVVLIAQAALEAASPRTLTRSAPALAALRVHSVAEAAALAAAGPGARLLAPRVAVGPVTCALAEEVAA